MAKSDKSSKGVKLDLRKEVHDVAPETAVSFFKGIRPFSDLDEATLQRIARHCRIDFFPKETRLLTADETEISHLYFIQKGGVKAFLINDEGEVTLKDYRGEGASIGALGIIRGTRANLNIETVEDTFCYLLPREIFLELVHNHPFFAQFYLKNFSEKLVRTAYQELRHHKISKRSSDDLYLFTITVGDLVKTLRTVPADVSIQEAAAAMSRHKVGSVLIHEVEDKEKIVGIITDRDLRSKVVAAGIDCKKPVTSIMSSPVQTVLSQTICFDVLLKMMSTGIHHLAVERGGRVIGVITSHDIMVLQGNSPYYLFKEIVSQEKIVGLYPLAQKIPEMIRNLLKEGAKSSNITRMIAIINDRILERMLTLLEKKMGPPPVSYCWMLLGSEGRREQTFKTDQDNAILYADPENEQQAKEAESYFKEFAERAIDHLVNCGYPLCPGEIMARNPKWCQPVTKWCEYFERWVLKPEPKELLHATIFFDFRCGFGDDSLTHHLRNHLIEKSRGQDIFTFHLAHQAMSNRVPLSFFKNFIVERDGEHKNQLDIKSRGLTPFVDFARVLSLKYGIKETNTMARFHALLGEGYISDDLYSSAIESYELQMHMRLIHQLRQIEEGTLPDNYIDPAHITDLERRMLKDAFSVIERLHGVLEKMFPIA